ncbi:MAG: hypothetical protein U0527_09585 [Candidatus Eisenbacteria bacterium]
MRHLLSALLLSILAAPTLAADFSRVYNGDELIHGTLNSAADGGCGTLLFNSDGSYENGYAWKYHGIVPPDYGSFAECFTVDYSVVCSAVFDFTQVGFQGDATMDVFLWDDAGGVPGNVICTLFGVQPGTIAIWPNLSRHTIPIVCECFDGAFWVGYWANWPGGFAHWYVGADLDGPGGCPLTNVAPGIGFPTGWTNVSQIWGPTQALGIGCETVDCSPVPVRESSFGEVKRLYR